MIFLAVVKRATDPHRIAWINDDWGFQPVKPLPVKIPAWNLEQDFAFFRVVGVDFDFDVFAQVVHVSGNPANLELHGWHGVIAGGFDIAAVTWGQVILEVFAALLEDSSVAAALVAARVVECQHAGVGGAAVARVV